MLTVLFRNCIVSVDLFQHIKQLLLFKLMLQVMFYLIPAATQSVMTANPQPAWPVKICASRWPVATWPVSLINEGGEQTESSQQRADSAAGSPYRSSFSFICSSLSPHSKNNLIKNKIKRMIFATLVLPLLGFSLAVSPVPTQRVLLYM